MCESCWVDLRQCQLRLACQAHPLPVSQERSRGVHSLIMHNLQHDAEGPSHSSNDRSDNCRRSRWTDNQPRQFSTSPRRWQSGWGSVPGRRAAGRHPCDNSLIRGRGGGEDRQRSASHGAAQRSEHRCGCQSAMEPVPGARSHPLAVASGTSEGGRDSSPAGGGMGFLPGRSDDARRWHHRRHRHEHRRWPACL